MVPITKQYVIQYFRFLYLSTHVMSPKHLRVCVVLSGCLDLGPVVQSPISTNPGLTLNKTYGVNPGLALIGL